MSDLSLNRDQIEALLRDTDCPEESAGRFLAAMDASEIEEQLRILRCQRCRLLERIHNEQRKLDELDYLRYQLEKADRPPVGEKRGRRRDE